MAKKRTVFQALDSAISGNWGDVRSRSHTNSYDMTSKGGNIIYKTTDKDDYEQKKLELQQNKFLKDRWVKANANMSVTAFAGLNNIKLMYRDADLMDAFPEIGAALDIVAEESCLPNDDGMVITVQSKSERVKSILEDLFVNRLNLQLTAQMVIRAMCKYGNQFMMLDVDHKNGVKGWKQLPVFNVERIESGIQNPYGAGASIAANGVNIDDADLSTQFIWLDDNNSQIPFRDWQIAHFRLLTNSLYLPYGVSYLNAARRHWRMLSLMEDMMLIYRLERSVERRVYKIFVGAIDDADLSTQFIWLDDNNSQIPFRDWQIAHFRLLTNSMYLPYGVSYLNAARRHFRMLSLMEDMMLIYRLERSIERRVYKIFVGAIDDADVGAYVEQIANEFKRTPIVDPMTGQLDLRKNILPVHKDTPIPLLDGRTITIEELSKEFSEGKENYVYSIQDKTLKIVPGKVVWCGKNYTAEKLIRITLDDGSHFDLAAEHELIMRDGVKKRADEVSVGESVMPFYRKVDKDSKKLFDRYEKVFNPNSGKYEFTHRIIAETVEKENDLYNTVHHKDFNKYNNSPCNLMWMDYHEHHKMHGDLARNNWKDPIKRKRHIENLSMACRGRIITEDAKKKISKTIKSKYDSGEFDFVRDISKKHIIEYNKSEKAIECRREQGIKLGYREEFKAYNESELHKQHDEIRKVATTKSWEGNGRTNRIQKMNIHFDDFIWDSLRDNILGKKIVNRKTMLEYINDNLIDHLIEINDNKRLENNHFISRGVLENRIRECGFCTITEYIKSMLKNHKIAKIETIEGDDVYCMTVVGQNGEEDRHNFAIRSLKGDGSLNDSGCFVSNCADQDIFLPVRSEDAPTPIDTLSAGQNITALDDIKFIQNKVLTALRIPKTFLNFEETAGDGKNLALMDVRFARTINRIQQAFLMELTKVASIHLFLLGFDDELNNFTLSMKNPSTQAEQLEIENLQKKIDAVRDAVSDPGNGLPVMSTTRALKNIMKWSEKDIKENFEEIRLEKGIAAELEKTTQIIKKTGIFDTVDRIYGEPGAEYVDDQQGGMDGAPQGGDMGGGGMTPPPMGDVGDVGGELDGLGSPNSDDQGDISGQEGTVPTQDMPTDDTATQQPMESRKSGKRPLINEERKLLDSMFDEYLSKVTESKNGIVSNAETKRADIYDSKSLLMNEEFDKMISSLGKFVDKKDDN